MEDPDSPSLLDRQASGEMDDDADGLTGGLGSHAGLGAGLGATTGLGMPAASTSDTDEPATTSGTGGIPAWVKGGIGFARASDQLPRQVSEAERVQARLDLQRVMAHFTSAEELTGTAPAQDADEQGKDANVTSKKPEAELGDSDSEAGSDANKVSKRKKKLESRLQIADLKQVCPRPEVVEVWDVTAQDPKLLVYLKAYRNSVPVPRHWSQKRKYLQGKRGIEKPPFVLPDFIEATGIGQMRQAYQEKEENKKLKQKQRDRMQPKVGKLDIDYQVLHDAFFKHQTKPHLTRLGEIYYEGKEFEARVKNAKPGILSEELRNGLGMAEGSPPPWLINMQRYGPPPSYPELKVPGLNAPIPPGTQFGYQAGGWGKPPVNEDGEPLYGDVFGQFADEEDDQQIDKAARWGDLESDEEESSEEEESEDEDEEATVRGDDEASLADGLASVGGVSSLPSGLETPEVIDLRKAKAGGDKHLYTVLEQQQAQIAQGHLMGSDHTYVIPQAGGAAPSMERRPQGGAAKRLEMLRQQNPSDVDVAITPEELEGLDEASIQALYNQRVAEERARNAREDFSDLVAQKAAQQKRKAAQAKESGKNKKQKSDTFKF
ncbi:hypothetical protein ABBQ32_007731 [Trebouxia sp. C0010 RCD-2024]